MVPEKKSVVHVNCTVQIHRSCVIINLITGHTLRFNEQENSYKNNL